jgi:hypothetical protein
MGRRALWVAAAVLVVSNACALGLVWANRAGDPDAVVELTERELRLAPSETENTAMALVLAWTDPDPGKGQAGWFDKAKLTEIGFDCSAPATAENARFYRGQAPRTAYAVLSLEPPAAEGDTQSRLRLVDVGRDAAALRARYPDRQHTIIAPAIAGLAFVQDAGLAPVIRGRVNVLLSRTVNVPSDQRRVLEPFAIAAGAGSQFVRLREPLTHQPRYRAVVKWGRSLEPWLERVEAIRIAGAEAGATVQ